MRVRWRQLWPFLWATLLALGLAGQVHAQERHVLRIEVQGAINHVTAGYVSRALERAATEQAELLVIRLDTPGGLLNSTQVIVQDLLGSRVPTAVYVAPSGARAGSAGTFITAAAHVAAMAPATNIGAASPVGQRGEDLPDTLNRKVTNDAAALIRSIAAARNRNTEALEETVRQATSFSAAEAMELNVVDLIAQDLPDLLARLDGRRITTFTGEVTLHTQGLPLREMGLNPVERFIQVLADPNIAYILLTLGGLGLVVEIMNPGLIFPGVAGVISLLLAYLGLGNLPVNGVGAAFLGLAVLLTVAEFYVAGFGALGVGAIVSFVLGSFLLFAQFGGASPLLPPVGVSLWLGVPTALALAGGGAWLLRTIAASRHPKVATGADLRLHELGASWPTASLTGVAGYVTSDLAPTGTVQVASELWSAVAESEEPIQTGERVRVVRVYGLVLTVRRVPRSS